MSAKQPFADLLAGLQQSKLSLVDVISALNARGPVQAPLHKAELAMLDDALSKKKLDDKLHRLLSAKLKEVQVPKMTVEKTAAYSAFKGDAEKTQMAGGGDKTTLNPAAGGDKTTINPAGGASGDATVVNTGTGDGVGGDGFDLLMGESDSDSTEMAGDAEATTGFKPADPATGRSRTAGTSGPNTSSWQRVATTGAPEREVHAGDVLKERFHLEKEVGRGGMGIVFKAKDERKVEAQDKNPWVAVKVLNPEFRKHPQALVALQRESRKAQQLTHDNILRVYDFDKDGTVIYMTMEYVDGGSLKDVIKKHPNGMPFEKGWPIIAGLAHGLGRAHRDNIVHSDFKPGNVMMTSDLVPKLFDMGIARAAKSGAEAKGETTVFDAGELGALTPAYASLEMIQGQPPELIDDIYALGVTAYEILTGKHPFNKKNAEQVMKEGLKPPVVPGLSRAQQKCLQQSVALKREDRLKTCDALINGMRARTMKDYALPVAIGAIALIILGIGINFTLGALKTHRIDAIGHQFEQSAFGEDTAAAVGALDAMKPDEKETAMSKYSTPMQDYFFKVANSKWDPDAKPVPKYHYAEAKVVLDAVQKLFPDSARVATEVSKALDIKNTKLKNLREEFDQRLQQGLIYEDKPGNVVDTLTVIGQIDPDYDLFKSKTLPLRYTGDVQKSVDAHDYERAATQVATAVKAFPGNADLKKLAESVKSAHATESAKALERERAAKMTAAEAKQELVKLAAKPDFSTDWQAGVGAAMSKLTSDTSPDVQQTKEKIALAYADQIGKMTADKQLSAAQGIAESAAKMFAGVPALMKEISKLTEARKAYEAEQAKAAALARVDDLRDTVKAQAKADDPQKAMKAFNELKSIVPNDPFLSGDGPKAIAEAYGRLAQRQAAQQRFAAAQSFVAEGLKLVPNMQSLKEAEKTYRVENSVATIKNASDQVASANGDKVKAAFEALRADDPQRAAKEASIENSVVSRIKALGASDPASGNKAKAEWLKVFPQSSELASLSFTATASAAPSSATTSAAAATTPQSISQEAHKAARTTARGVDSCSASYAGFGRSSKAACQDGSGPKLVVVPGVGGGAPFAISKYEITIEQFDAFCTATGKCKPQGGNGALPRTDVSLGNAKAYAAWLSEQTGFTYRLPTDAEWSHAAGAGGQGSGEDFNCVLMQGGNQIKGGFPVPAASGKPNPWGLVNAVGNAAEWTDSGSARGGHFNTPMSQCTVDSKQSGSDSDTVGLRLVREMG